jgi:hypothetical protein
MNSDITTAEVEAAQRALRARVAKFLIRERDAVDVRTMTILRRSGVLRADRSVSHSGITPAMLSSPPDLPLPAGPLHCFLERDGDNRTRWILDVDACFFDDDRELRTAALRRYREQILARQLCTARTAATLDGLKDDLLADEPSRWQRAAVTVSDRVRDDFLINLAGLDQALVLGFEEAYQTYLTRVLRPSLSSVDGLPIVIWNPREQRADVERAIAEASAKETLGGALDHYVQTCGHVPLDRSLSAAQAVEEWAKAHPNLPDVWGQADAWVATRAGPLAEYHFCQIFLCLPQFVPKDNWAQFWSNVVGVLGTVPSSEMARPPSELMALRCDLARHYCHFFETRTPGQSGERIATLAWWLSDRVAARFGIEADEIRRLRETTIAPEALFSGRVWELVNPPIKRESLRYVTLKAECVWATALANQLSRGLPEYRAHVPAGETLVELERSFAAQLLAMAPPTPAGQDPVYAFEADCLPSLERYAAGSVAAQPEFLRGVATFVGEMTNASQLDEQLSRVGQATEAEDALIGQVLRAFAFVGRVDAEVLWQRVCDPSWRQRLFRESPRVLPLFLEALTQVAGAEGGKWASHLPHLFASDCEATVGDDGRRRTLFSCCVLTSLCGDTVSAVERLIRGPDRAQFTGDVADWQAQIRQLQPALSEWAAGRLRALSAALALL